MDEVLRKNFYSIIAHPQSFGACFPIKGNRLRNVFQFFVVPKISFAICVRVSKELPDAYMSIRV